MAAYTTKFEFDLAAKTATWLLIEGGVTVTNFDYANGQVTVASRPTPLLMNFQEHRANLDDLRRWCRFIIDNFGFGSEHYGLKHEVILKRKANSVVAKLSYVDDLMIDGTWSAATGIATYAARPGLTLGWSDFFCFVDTVALFLGEIERF